MDKSKPLNATEAAIMALVTFQIRLEQMARCLEMRVDEGLGFSPDEVKEMGGWMNTAASAAQRIRALLQMPPQQPEDRPKLTLIPGGRKDTPCVPAMGGEGGAA